jgi:hypothetical protein
MMSAGIALVRPYMPLLTSILMAIIFACHQMCSSIDDASLAEAQAYAQAHAASQENGVAGVVDQQLERELCSNVMNTTDTNGRG